ncbi:uncharacterized protein LOC130441524 [Diorhabda sublineata]|uniref:uncharacterized protein LOC130441524 n=1 Tax=Diorhabda sublineata TaxID=1163346 RepID=UPI0024E11417|nr:uncharacterized protein LOC130441524 [Diorhabda sublineata]
MGNAHIKPHPRQRHKKQVHWKAAARPYAPGKPFLVTDVEPTPDLVTIRWIKPISDGGSPISGYLVEHRRAGSPHWVRATPLLVQTNELTISGLEPGWRYQFRVTAENAVGISDPSELSEPITVTLQRSAVTAPRITQELKDTDALENEKAEFVVHFLGQPPPKVCWYKDAFEIFSSRRIRILTESDRSVLTIHQCSLSDEGEIKCTATNRAGHVASKAKLVVQAPPSVRLPRQYEEGLLFEIGELIRLKVSVAGRPTPLVFWSHNGESIKNNDRYEMEYVDNSTILKITDAKREDRGEYLVKAVNKLGEHTQSFLVTVTDKPSPPGKARVLMALGRSVTLTWSVPNDDGGCKIGNYIVEYYRLGWDVWLKAATSRQVTTMLGDLIEGSEYKFRVKAESPYGVSEPSEESEVIFIPDKKRGILEPSARSRSQPREIEEPPMVKRKNRSATRMDNLPLIQEDEPPKRPIRTKVKSPSKTPEASPLPTKKDLNNLNNKRELETKLNKEIFERSDSLTRDLAYGSPGIKVRKELSPESNQPDISTKTATTDHAVFKVRIEPPETEQNPSSTKDKLPRDNSDNFTGSSEFMLVLYPDENQKGQTDFDLDDDMMPPPMSLSAPELGNEAPIFNPIKSSASSTELLHERAMKRLYEAAKAEERELERRRISADMKGLNIEIPKIQINSKDQPEIERIKRRLSGGSAQQFWTRRHSLKNSEEFGKFNNKRSKSEEIEEEIFEKIRSGNQSREKRKINIADVEKWADDYVSSTEESSNEEDDNKNCYLTDEEEQTYHPRGLRSMSFSKEEPFEILTKRKEPPSPDFVPKPILKKKEQEDTQSPSTSPKLRRSSSPIPPNITSNPTINFPLLQKTIPEETSRSRSSSLTPNDKKENRPSSPRKRAFSLLPQIDLFEKSNQKEPSRKRSFSLIPQEDSTEGVIPETIYNLPSSKPSFLMQTISAAATISGITAASIVIPDRLAEKQKDAEESKVVVDHYSDIVKNYGNRTKSLTRSRESLQKSKDSLQNIEDTKLTQISSETPRNYHDNYPSYKNVSSDLNNKNTVFSSTSSAESGYISSNTSKVTTPTKEESSFIQKHPTISQNSENPVEKEESIKPEEVISSSSYRPFSPNKEKKNRPFSPSNRSPMRKSSTSPLNKPEKRKTPSPYPKSRINKDDIKSSRCIEKSPVRIRHPKLKEIMTQTSEGLGSMDENYPEFLRQQRQMELTAEAEIKVHNFFDYITDLVMFSLACWFYLFSNELFAIPVLLVLVYRQLQAQYRHFRNRCRQIQDNMSRRIPLWFLRLIRKSKKE